jgi:hypothetical protein
LNIVIYNIILKPENNYSLLVSPIIFPEATIDIGKKKTQPIANYINLLKVVNPKEIILTS